MFYTLSTQRYFLGSYGYGMAYVWLDSLFSFFLHLFSLWLSWPILTLIFCGPCLTVNHTKVLNFADVAKLTGTFVEMLPKRKCNARFWKMYFWMYAALYAIIPQSFVRACTCRWHTQLPISSTDFLYYNSKWKCVGKYCFKIRGFFFSCDRLPPPKRFLRLGYLLPSKGTFDFVF